MGTDLNGREPTTSVEKDGGKSESAGSNQGAVLNGREPLVADKWRSMGKGGG